MVIEISDEATQMKIEEGDRVKITLSYTDASQDEVFSGLYVLKLLLDGHILKSVDGSIYAMFDPLGISKDESCKCSYDIWLAYADPIDDAMPRLTWISRCNDALALATGLSWFVESNELATEMIRNTRAYHAIIEDSRHILASIGEEITESSVDEIIGKLNDAGWDYDEANNKGVYDASRLDVVGDKEVDPSLKVTRRLPGR